MIQKFGHYIIPYILDTGNANWPGAGQINELVDDFVDTMRKHGIEVFPEMSEFINEEDLVDLMIYSDTEVDGTLGTFFITWYKEGDWECDNIWFSERNDTDAPHKSWDNI